MEAPKQLLTKHNLLNVNEDVITTKDTKCFVGDYVFSEQYDDQYVTYRTCTFYPNQTRWNVPVENITKIAEYLKQNNVNIKVNEESVS